MYSNKTVTERLDIIMNELGENANSFSGKIGVTRSTIAGAISRNKGVNTDLLQKISDVFPSINIDWLVTGKGDKFKISAGRDNNIVGGDNSGVVGSIGGHNVSIGGDTKAKKIIEKDHIIIELEQSAELYKQKAESLETRIKDLESLLKAKEEIIEMLKNK